jgi:hypothetical protein
LLDELVPILALLDIIQLLKKPAYTQKKTEVRERYKHGS